MSPIAIDEVQYVRLAFSRCPSLVAISLSSPICPVVVIAHIHISPCRGRLATSAFGTLHLSGCAYMVVKLFAQD